MSLFRKILARNCVKKDIKKVNTNDELSPKFSSGECTVAGEDLALSFDVAHKRQWRLLSAVFLSVRYFQHVS